MRGGGVASPRPNCAGDDFPDFLLCYEMEGAMCRLSLVFVKAPHATHFYPEEMPASIYVNLASDIPQNSLAAEATA